MDRIEIEIKLNRDRAWLLEKLGAMTADELNSPRTFSEHDADSRWSFADHFVHTTLIERNWNEMFRRHVSGDQGLAPRLRSDGTPQSMEEIMTTIHGWTEEWKAEHNGKPFIELVRIGQEVRADTIALLAELTDDDLASKIPGAPWSDGPSAASWRRTPTTVACTTAGPKKTRSPQPRPSEFHACSASGGVALPELPLHQLAVGLPREVRGEVDRARALVVGQILAAVFE